MKLPIIQSEGITIPEIDISQTNCVVIEFGLSLGRQIKNLTKFFKTTYKKFNILSADKEFRLTFWEQYFKKITIRDYFKKHKLSNEDIDTFFEYAKDSYEKDDFTRTTIFKELPSNYQKVVHAFILTRKSNKILVDTISMHLGLIMLTYRILQDFIKNGGFVIEVGYPHSSTMEHIEDMLQTKVKSIQLGEMRIVAR